MHSVEPEKEATEEAAHEAPVSDTGENSGFYCLGYSALLSLYWRWQA